MGEIADAMLDGTVCQECGVFIEEPPANGIPRHCTDCRRASRGKGKRMKKTRLTWAEFSQAVATAGRGLNARHCAEHHWQIQGGDWLVNCWPNSNRGFVMQKDGEQSRVGSLREAIDLASPPKAKPATETVAPPWEETRDRPVGLIRRLWRWIW